MAISDRWVASGHSRGWSVYFCRAIDSSLSPFPRVGTSRPCTWTSTTMSAVQRVALLSVDADAEPTRASINHS